MSDLSIERAIAAAENRYCSVMAEHVPVDSPSGILNRVGISQLYGEKYGNDQELIDWRLRMHGIGKMALTDTLVARLEAEQAQQEQEEVITGELVSRHNGTMKFDHVEEFLEDPEHAIELLTIFCAIEDYANESFTYKEYRERQNEAHRYFHALSNTIGVES